MDHLDIKTSQAKQLEKRIFEMRSYLRGLQNRIRDLRFPADDELKKRVDSAESAISHLQALVSCMATGGGMGRQPQKNP